MIPLWLVFRHQPSFSLLGQDGYNYWLGAAGALEVGRLRVPTNLLGTTYFTYQTSPDLNTKHHLRLVSNDHIELREGATIGGLEAESRVSIFTLDPGAFCTTFDQTDMPGMKYHTYDHLGNLRVTYRRVGASLPVDALYEYSPYGRVVQTYQAAGRDRYLSTGHEREEATNYDYRLARLYDAELGRFLGVDVMAHKRSWISPYNYVQNNPIIRIDPTGAIDTEFKDRKGNTISKIDDGSNAVFQLTGNSRFEEYFKFVGFNEKQGGKNIVNVESSIKGAQDYTRINYTSVINDKGVCTQTYCNFGTMNIARTYESALAAIGQKAEISDIKGTSRDIGGKLETSTTARTANDLVEAQNAAKAGSLVIGYWPGHVFTLDKQGFVNNVGAPRAINNLFDPKYTKGTGQKFYIIQTTKIQDVTPIK